MTKLDTTVQTADEWSSMVWTALEATAKATFELTPNGRLYTLDGLDCSGWASVDAGQQVKNGLCD